MTIPDDDLARAKNISVEQVRMLRDTRGATNESLEGMPEPALRRALRRIDYPDMPRARELFRREQERDDDGRVPGNALAAAVAARALMVATTTRRSAAGVPTGPAAGPGGGPTAGLESAVWEWIGPGNIGGRTLGIVMDPADPARMWSASAGGGVWQTTDGGVAWAPVDDFLVNLACACIAMDPSQPSHIYAGTGEGFSNVDALRGAGIFRTTDATTWAQLPSTATPDFFSVNRIAVSSSGAVLAATGTGIFRSVDAARAVWTKVHSVATGDVRFDPGDDTRAVAGAVNAAEAWFSRDGGVTWTAAAHGPWSGRVELAYAAADPAIVYASVQATHGEIWRSEDGGQTYHPRKGLDVDGNAAPYLGDQGWYDNVIWAGDPSDSELVVVGGINLWRSQDGGDHLAEISTWWAAPPSAHADQHAFVADPGYDGVTNRRVVVGNDGGVYLAEDLAAVGTEAAPPHTSGWTELENNYGATQFYGAAGNATSGKIVGGAQDNGTLCYDPATGTEQWTTIFGGDGGWCAADPTDPMVLYGEYVFLNIHRNTDGGTTDDTNGDRYISGQFFNQATNAWDWKPVPFQIPDAKSQNALFIAPFVLDPNDPDRLLAGGLQLWRTSEAKRANTPTSGPRWASIKTSAGSAISAIAVAPADSNVVWVGHRNGMVFRTTNGTAAAPTWQRVGATGPTGLKPQRYCTCITVDPVDPGTVYVAFGGYLPDNVWITRNGGADWAPPASVLPPAPVRAVAVHPRRSDHVYLGTEVGVFASDDAGGHWSPTNEGPSNCSVDDFIWMDDTLVAVTHGRGMFRIDLSGV